MNTFMHTFSKDWARWSQAERLVIKLVGLLTICGGAGEFLMHVVV